MLGLDVDRGTRFGERDRKPCVPDVAFEPRRPDRVRDLADPLAVARQRQRRQAGRPAEAIAPSGPTPNGTTGATGAEYIRAKAHRTEAARLLHEPLAFLARESVMQSGPEMLRAAYLVDREAVESFVGLVRRLQETHEGLRVLCTGPWPPYSFAQP